MMKCRVCEGSGKQTLTINILKGDGWEHQQTEIGCVWCHGTGRMTTKALAEWNVEQSMWCRCNREIPTTFKDDGECNCGVHKHHYHCRVCGNITQVG